MNNYENISNINLNLFKFFVASVESKSFAEAGEKLGYSAPTVSTNISNLENQIGTKLFTRKPLKPTIIGQEIYELIKNGFTSLDFAILLAQCKNNINYGKLSIGCPSHIADFFLMKRIAQAMKNYPKLQVKLDTESSSDKLIEELKTNNIDFIIIDTISDKYKKDIEIKELKKVEYTFVSREKITINKIKDLENYKYILSYDDRASSINLFDTLKKEGVSLQTTLRCPTTEQRINAAKLGIGIAYVMKDVVVKELKNQKLYEVKIPIKLPINSLKIVYMKNHLTKVDKQFINDYLK